jgi:hypothetical protein
MTQHFWEDFADEALKVAVLAFGDQSGDVAKQAASLPGFVKPDRGSTKGLAAALRRLGQGMQSDQFSVICERISRDDEALSQVAPTLALLAAVETSVQRRRVVASIGGTPDGTWTFGAIHHTLPHATAAIHPSATLSTSGLIVCGNTGPWARRPVWLSPILSWKLLVETSDDADLPTGLKHLSCLTTPSEFRDLVVVVSGPDDHSRQMHALQLLGGGDAHVVVIRADTITTESGESRSVLVGPQPEQWDAIIRDATLAGAAVIVDAERSLPEHVHARIVRAKHLRWAITTRNNLGLAEMPRRQWAEFTIDHRIASTEAVRSALGPGASLSHRLTITQLDQVRDALPSLNSDIDRAARRLISGELDHLASRISPRRSWSDLVLPPAELAQVRQVAARYQHRGMVLDEWGFGAVPSGGVIALFSGPPGTGKTLSAEVIANELGLDLFRVNIATMVSKYIGETEKNLERLFDAADTGNVVLLFDEADSMFGKRGSVSQSNDRYANLEVSYLLQRIETFDGLVVMTTNLEGNIDQAFTRRIHISVKFELPNQSERLVLWQKSIPEGAPQADLDLPFLSGFDLSGADIRNIAVASAFSAAAAGVPISMTDLVVALVQEFRKSGRLLDQRTFGDYWRLAVDTAPNPPIR